MTTKCECDNLRGAIAAQDERERLAGDRCGIPYHEYGCDWPDRMADEVLALRVALKGEQEVKSAIQREAFAAFGNNGLAQTWKEQVDALRAERDNASANMRVLAQAIADSDEAVVGILRYWMLLAPDAKGPVIEPIYIPMVSGYTREDVQAQWPACEAWPVQEYAVRLIQIGRLQEARRVLEHAWTMFQEQLRECEYDAQRCPSETRLFRLHIANLYNNTLALLLRQTKGEER